MTKSKKSKKSKESKNVFDMQQALKKLNEDEVFFNLYNTNDPAIIPDDVLCEQIKLTLTNAGFKTTRAMAKLILIMWKQKHPPPKKKSIDESTKERWASLTVNEIDQMKRAKKENVVTNYYVTEVVDPKTNHKLKRTIKMWLEDKKVGILRDVVYIDLDIDTLMSDECYDRLFKRSDTKALIIYTIKDLQDVYEKLKTRQSEFLYFKKDIFYKLIALISIATYFTDVFYTICYVDIHSPEAGFGKTLLMEIIVYSSFHGVWDIDITPANIFRRLKDGVVLTMGFDDLDKKYDRDTEPGGLTPVIDSGYKKGARVPRYNQRLEITERFPTFGPKIWTRKKKIPSTPLSRAISIPMVKNFGQKVIKNRPAIPKDFKELRDTLYCLRWYITKEVKKVYKDLYRNRILTGRVGEVFIPVLTIAKLIDEELYDEIFRFATTHEDKRYSHMMSHMRAMLIQVLCKNINFRGKTKGIDICKEYNFKLAEEKYLPQHADGSAKDLTAPKVYEILDTLHFNLDDGAGGWKYVDVDIEVLEEHARTYGFIDLFNEAEEKRKNREKSRDELRAQGLTEKEILKSEQLEVIGRKISELTGNGEKL